MINFRRGIALPIGLRIVLALTGCSDKPEVTVLPQGEKNLRIIARVYTKAAQSLGRSPNNVEELKPFLKDYGNPDELLVSPNDGKPYVIVPGVNLKKALGWPVLAYEQEGKNGNRQYVDLSMNAKTATEEELARLRVSPTQPSAAGK
jgi:hypothetical protein